MSLIISEQTEALVTEEARRQGVSVDELLRQLIERDSAESAPREEVRELPVWHLGATGAFHRRDIYDNVH